MDHFSELLFLIAAILFLYFNPKSFIFLTSLKLTEIEEPFSFFGIPETLRFGNKWVSKLFLCY